MQRITVSVGDSLGDELRLLAARHRATVSALAARMLEEGVERRLAGALDGGEPRAVDGSAAERQASNGSGSDATAVSSPPSSAALTPDRLEDAGGGGSLSSRAAAGVRPDPKPGGKR